MTLAVFTRSRSGWIRFATLCVLIALLGQKSKGAEGPPTKGDLAQLKMELLKPKITDRSVTASGTFSLTYSDKMVDDHPHHVEYSRNGDMRLLRVQTIGSDGRPVALGEQVFGTDGQLCYSLTMGPKRAYIVNSIGKNREEVDRRLNFYAERYFEPVVALSFLPNLHLRQYSLHENAIIHRSGRNVKRIRFHGRTTEGIGGLLDATLLMSPDEGNVLLDFHSSITPAGTKSYGMEGDFEFQGIVGDVAIPSRSVIKNLNGGEVEQKATFVFDRFEPVAPPASQFRLSAFHLGDLDKPPGVSSNNTMAYLAFAIGGICLAATITLRILAARRRTSSAA